MIKHVAERSYAPWRQRLLTREELKILSRPNFLLSARKAVAVWMQIIFFWAAAVWVNESDWMLWWLGIPACAAMVGNRYYALYILGHDGLHRRLHPNTKLNDLFNDLLCIGPIGAVTHRNRSNHMAHHRHFATAADPDMYKYASRRSMGAGSFIISLTAIPFVWRAVLNVYRDRDRDRDRDDASEGSLGKLERYTGRDLLIIAGWQVCLVSALSALFGWWGYLLMWLVPVYIFTFAADMARVYCEHSSGDDEALNRLPYQDQWVPRCVTFMVGTFEKILFAPLNMNHHAAHHLWPAIPWHNLPAATSLVIQRAPLPSQEGRGGTPFHIVRKSYIGWLLQCRDRNQTAHSFYDDTHG